MRGEIHTNTIEGFFGNLKTGMRGTYKHVSHRWLQSYLDEYAYRYNERLLSTTVYVPQPARQGREMSARKATLVDPASRQSSSSMAYPSVGMCVPTIFARYCVKRKEASPITHIASEASLSPQGVYYLLAAPPSP